MDGTTRRQRGLQEASVDRWEMPSLGEGDIEESPKTGEFATLKAPSQPVPQSSGRNNHENFS
jgi:hypothetical protein